MRLLNVRTLELEEFFHNIPPYAILSHTWGVDEITYDMLLKDRSALYSPFQRIFGLRVGFRKIELACRQAKRDCLSHIWIDTCCIDKSSSAELSKAINSMFAWYRDATICYAYLEDVPSNYGSVPEQQERAVKYPVGEDCEDLLNSTFASNRWFTRGWTLQELIAPANVTFYDNAFGFIGTKQGLAYLLKLITRIDEALLTGERPIEAFCIARRMFWAAKRETTRVEDRAYSLLGIFDINMPLIYGEGPRAFRRLQEKIIKSSADQSIFAWEDLAEGPRTLFAPSPNSFLESGSTVVWNNRTTNEKSSTTTMTSKGLVVQLPLAELRSSYGSCLHGQAVLSCRYEDNLLGPIALNIDSLDAWCPTEPYTLAQAGARLSVVPLSALASSRKSARITEYANSDSRITRTVSVQENRKCWAKFVDQQDSFSIIDAYPKRSWNWKTGVFLPAPGPRVCGGVYFRNSSNGRGFLLILGYRCTREVARNSPRFYSEWVMLLETSVGDALEQLCSKAGAGFTAKSQLNVAPYKIEASMIVESIMDESVFVINLHCDWCENNLAIRESR
jgi:hypothetical protein